MVKQLVISGFPGTGKSYYVSRGEGSDYMPQGFASDSDSSKFDKSNFPQNYIEHIKELIAEGTARIFVSSHKEVRDELVKEGIDFILVYPKKELKEEYIERYKQRGSSDSFIKIVSENWDNWITELENQKGCTHKQLESKQFMYDIF
jgi:hypothetical protein